MKKIFFLIKIFFIYCFLISSGISKESGYLKRGKELFNKKEFDKSKIFFERDLVFDPKSEMSYLYLAKIFEKKENDIEQETNLKNVLINMGFLNLGIAGTVYGTSISFLKN